ncbi:exopolysaccharide biosynthesis protein [Marinicauda algicola]|uniref:Exopolysaccharide biosynthesis protein n=1 Tax=Marinicauda algicola TaxID=2029849 RepID=A0A4S2GZJ5_9PROT|nr:exopolysaccharide biosynthesis protein [Marinicauda algicola]TGY88586.1 exopolysaccharide biosynthesis protein [Marinicauda algicola]
MADRKRHSPFEVHPARLEDVLEDLRAQEGGETISVDEILEALAHRSFGPLLLVPALISVLPVVGALPGVSYAMALVALVISIHFALSRPKLWLPGRLRRVSFGRKAFDRGLEKARPFIRWLDRFVLPRFAIAFRKPMPRVISLMCVAVSALMVLYASVPGGVVIPAIALILLGLGLTTQDGLVTILGVIAGVVTIAGTFWLVALVI